MRIGDQPGQSVWVRAFWLFLFPAFLLAAVYPPRLDGYLNPYDEGLWLGLAQALLEGKKLYRDVFFHYGPLLGLAVQSSLRVVPVTLSSLRGAFWMLNAAGLLTIYFCLLRWVWTPATRLAFAIFFFAVPLAAQVPTIPMAARYAAGFLPLLCWPIGVDSDAKVVRLSVLSGLLSLCACLISQEVGIAASLAGVYYFCFGPEVRYRRRWFIFGAVAGLSLAMVWLVPSGLLRPYLRCAFFETPAMVFHGRLPMPSMTFPRTHLPAPWFIAWEGVGDILSFYLPVLTYAATGFFLLRRRLSNPWAVRRITALVIFGVLTAVTAWGRSDRWHIYFALSPMLFLWAVLMEELSQTNQNGVILLSVALGALLTLPHVAARQFKDRMFRSFSRPTTIDRAGASRLPFPQANGYEVLVRWIHSHTKPGESFMFYPYDGTLYFLADRTNPSFYPVLALAATPALQEKVLQELKARPPEWVIWDTQNTAFDGVPIETFLHPIHDFLVTHYKIQQTTGPFRFMRRIIVR